MFWLWAVVPQVLGGAAGSVTLDLVVVLCWLAKQFLPVKIIQLLLAEEERVTVLRGVTVRVDLHLQLLVRVLSALQLMQDHLQAPILAAVEAPTLYLDQV
jgi:hypothetical protein